jgi:hypothetical protein
MRIAGIGVAAGGVALGIIGIGLAAAAPGIADDSSHASSMANGRTQYDRAATFNTAGWSLIGVGAAIAIAGAVIAALPRRSERMHASAGTASFETMGAW